MAHSGYRMLVPASDHGDPEAHQDNDIAFTPMALPLIAGPGAIGEVIGLSARYTEPRERLAHPYRRIGDIHRHYGAAALVHTTGT